MHQGFRALQVRDARPLRGLLHGQLRDGRAPARGRLHGWIRAADRPPPVRPSPTSSRDQRSRGPTGTADPRLITSSTQAVEIPVPPGQSPLDVLAAIIRLLVDEQGAEVAEAHDLMDGT